MILLGGIRFRRLRLSILASVVICAVSAVSLHGASAQASGSASSASASKACKKGFVRKRGKCVCPTGEVRSGRKCVCPKGKVRSGKKCVTPKPKTPIAPADGPPFSPPSSPLTGTPAANAILPYLANSTFTDCVGGYPTCAVESRYGHFGDGSMYYCRLTSSSGSDIINAPHPFVIIGADQAADGSWAVTLQVTSYGNALTYYTWAVSNRGVAYGRYWGPGSDPRTDAPSDQLGPLQWVRGARNCSY